MVSYKALNTYNKKQNSPIKVTVDGILILLKFLHLSKQ